MKVNSRRNSAQPDDDGDDVVVLDGVDMSDVLLGKADNVRKNMLLPFWNGPEYGKVGTSLLSSLVLTSRSCTSTQTNLLSLFLVQKQLGKY